MATKTTGSRIVGNGKAGINESAVDFNSSANDVITAPAPTILGITIQGVSKLLFHRYDCESVDTKGKAAKGSKAKKTDDIISYLYIDDDKHLVIPSDNIHACLANSARSFQDPRSPRKSACDLFKAGILVQPDLLKLRRLDGTHYGTFDFLDRRRAIVQQSAVSRTRPGLEAGWSLDADITILLPHLISIEMMRNVLVNAGSIIGLCDFRPRYGRFQITRAEIIDLE